MSSLHSLQFSGWTLLPKEQQVQDPGGRRHPLEPKAVEVLQCLTKAAGGLVSRDDLIRQVWPEVFVTDASLYRCIYLLRQVLGSGEAPGPRILTVRSQGYRLVSPEVQKGRESADRPPRKSRGRPRLGAPMVHSLAGAAILVVVWILITSTVRPDTTLDTRLHAQVPLSVVFRDSLQVGSLLDRELERDVDPARVDSIVQGLSLINPGFQWISEGSGGE